MSKVKVVMNPAGVRALLNAPGVVADLDARAERIQRPPAPGSSCADATSASTGTPPRCVPPTTKAAGRRRRATSS